MVNDLVRKDGKQELEVLNGFNINPKNYTEAMEICTMLSKTDFIPKDFVNKPGNIFVAIAMGAELGLKSLHALQCIAVINGRPTIWGDGLVALVLGSGQCEYIKDEFDEKTQTAICRAKRNGRPEVVKTFSFADAKQAGLAGNNTHAKYPKRMIEWRAKSWALRAEFADLLKGISIREEFEIDGAVEADIVPQKNDTVSLEIPAMLPEENPTIPEEQVKMENPSLHSPEIEKTVIDRSKMLKAKSKKVNTCAECSMDIATGADVEYTIDPKVVVHAGRCPSGEPNLF